MQSVRGDRNVQISHVGAGAQIQVSIAGQPPVLTPLRQAHVPVPPGVTSPARLLRARGGVVPFLDRPELTTPTLAWLHSDEAFSTYLVGGRGGTGKTRLGIHLCQHATARGWIAGLLANSTDPVEVATLTQLPAPRLVVVDYAETRAEQLEVLLPALEAHTHRDTPVRVLLLIRASPRTGADWDQPLRDRRNDELDTILDTTTTQVLDDTPLTPAQRHTLHTTASTTLLERLTSQAADHARGQTVEQTTQRSGDEAGGQQAEQPAVDPARPSGGSPDGPTPASGGEPIDLDGAVFANPLLVITAAYLAVHGSHRAASGGGTDRTIPETRTGLLRELAGHEDAYWQATAAAQHCTLTDTLRRRVCALAALAGADGETEAVRLLALLPELADAPAERRHQLAEWSAGHYPGPSWWNPLEPDLLAEHLVAEHLTALPDVIAGALTRDTPAQLNRPLELLTRALPEYPELARTVQAVLNRKLVDLCQTAIAQAVNEPDLRLQLGTSTSLAANLDRLLEQVHPLHLDPEPLAQAISLFPNRADQILTPLALTLTTQLANHFRRLVQRDPVSWQPALAEWLNNLSNRLGHVGRRDEALRTIEEAVAIRRRLARLDPAMAEPQLAESLNDLAVRLPDFGRHHEALTTIEDAVTIRRRLAGQDPDAWEPHLARSLNNLSVRLASVGRDEQALTTIEEAVTIRRRLAQQNPDVWEPDLAFSLNNLSVRLADAGRNAQALTTIEEVVAIRRRLAQQNPAAWEPNLAKSLNNFAVRLADVGRHPEALTTIEEAVTIARRLSHQNPAAWEPDLATFLSNLSKRLAHARHSDRALTTIEEAVTIRRRLAQQNPVAWNADLVKALNFLSRRLVDVGRTEEARRAALEAASLTDTARAQGASGDGG